MVSCGASFVANILSTFWPQSLGGSSAQPGRSRPKQDEARLAGNGLGTEVTNYGQSSTEPRRPADGVSATAVGPPPKRDDGPKLAGLCRSAHPCVLGAGYHLTLAAGVGDGPPRRYSASLMDSHASVPYSRSSCWMPTRT